MEKQADSYFLRYMLRKCQAENLRSDLTLHIRSLPHDLVMGGIPHVGLQHPTALFTLRMTPWSHGYSLYETVYGRLPPIIKQVSTNLPQIRRDEISQQMEQLGKVINQATKFVQERVPFPLEQQIHEVPGDLCQGLATRLLGLTLEGSIYCCSNHPYGS